MSKPRTTRDTPNGDSPLYAEIAVPVPLRRTFTYSLAPEDASGATVGARAVVPFGNRKMTGYIVDFHAALPAALEPGAVKRVTEVLDAEPLLTEEILRLTQWAADYYMASWGEILKASLPAGINANIEHVLAATEQGFAALAEAKSRRALKWQVLEAVSSSTETVQKDIEKEFGAESAKRAVRELAGEGLISVHHRNIGAQTREKRQKAVRLLVQGPWDGQKLNRQQTSTLETLQAAGGEMLFTELVEGSDAGASSINTLAKRGMLEVFVRDVARDPMRNARIPKREVLTLTDEQSAALCEIERGLEGRSFKTFLLHGVTGSGKTEVYIRAMQKALADGRSSLMLVPEIALTPVFSRRLKAVFGEDVAILHSSLSQGERFDEWRRIRRGEARIVIGTRSAVFAPLVDIGLVIIDEEHDGSYRQQDAPFYSARDVAVVRAKFAEAVAVLGSATPSMESFHNAQTGRYEYLRLPNRVGARPLASAEVIDMRDVFRTGGKDTALSPALVHAIEETHARGEQSMIFLNRRGFSQFVLCRSCGESVKCDNCDITLTFHKRKGTLVCHYCNHVRKAPDRCPKCDSEYLYYIGEGTEQIEDQLTRQFPKLRIARIDRDTIQRRHELEDTLERFGQGELDMLVGTQMIAKGHDFHNVTLVGVISVDTALGLPDFRSAERTFQLLTQVAGRAGRGDLKGRVLIQTYYPEHYVIRHACAQDYEGFYKEEIEFREKLAYPPFSAVASILIRHTQMDVAMDNARILGTSLQLANKDRHCRVLGPSPAPLSRLRNEHRLQILLKSPSRARLREVLEAGLAAAEAKKCDMRMVAVEIDPVNLL